MSGKVPPPSGEPEKKQIEQERYPESAMGAQRLSKGGELKKMTFWQGVVYYVFFGWVAALFTPKAEKESKIEIGNRIENLFPKDKGDAVYIVLVQQFNEEQLRQLEPILQDPSARSHLLTGGPKLYQTILLQFLKAPEKTKEVFQNFARAQNLLNGRVDRESGFEINAYFLEQPIELQKKIKAFYQEAHRLQSMDPRPLAPSKETQLLTNEQHPTIASQVADKPLAANLLQEIVFTTTISNTQPIAHALSGSVRAKPYFHTLYGKRVPFALQFQYESTENALFISVSDPATKEVRRAEILIPKEITREALASWLTNPRNISLNEAELEAAQKFKKKADQAFAHAILSLNTAPQEGKKGEIYVVADQYGDKQLSFSPTTVQKVNPAWVARAFRRIREGGGTFSSTENFFKQDIEIAVNTIDTHLEVIFKRGDRSYTARYRFNQDESQQELALRIYGDRTLERDFMLASLKLFEE